MSDKRRMDKQNGIFFSLKRNEILIHATTWMKLEDIAVSEIRPVTKE
jgi:hypothetical protein